MSTLVRTKVDGGAWETVVDPGGGGDWWLTTATGPVTISPSDFTAPSLDILGGVNADVTTILSMSAADPLFGSPCFRFYSDGGLVMRHQNGNDPWFQFTSFGAGDFLVMESDNALKKIGFFGSLPAAQPTGVAVNAAGIHAALVTLGLIAA